MPIPSNRAGRVPASPIRRLVPVADATKSRGIHVHHLNIGQPDVETPREMIAAVQSFDLRVLAYGPSEGLPELRKAASEYFRRVGEQVDPQQIFVTTGGSEALLFAFAAVADPGDEILVPEPFYANYAAFAALLGIELRPLMTLAEHGFHLPSEERIEAALGERTRAIVLANPGNPTGTVYTKEELERLARVALRRDLFIISDEVYREFVYGDGRFVSALSLPEVADRVIITDSISKRFSACGARIGFVFSRNAELTTVFRRLCYARLCPPTIEQYAAIAGYRLDPSYFDPVIAEYRKRRDLLIEGLRTIRGVSAYAPEGAFYAMVTLPVADADDFCQWLLTDFSHQRETVMLAPGSGFYSTPGAGQQEVRVAYVLNADALARSIDILRHALDAYAGTVRPPL